MEKLSVKSTTAAAMLGVSLADIRRFIGAGQLQAFGNGHGLRIMASSVEALREWRAQSNHIPPGYVYIIRLGRHCKIGITKNMRRRMISIQGSNPEHLEIVHTIPTNNMRRAERQIHEQFASRRIRGEWFDLSDDDIAVARQYE